MNYRKLFTTLKIILILILIVLMLVIQNYKSSDCAYCEFEVEDKEVGISKFMNAYSDKCFPKYEDAMETLKNNS